MRSVLSVSILLAIFVCNLANVSGQPINSIAQIRRHVISNQIPGIQQLAKRNNYLQQPSSQGISGQVSNGKPVTIITSSGQVLTGQSINIHPSETKEQYTNGQAAAEPVINGQVKPGHVTAGNGKTGHVTAEQVIPNSRQPVYENSIDAQSVTGQFTGIKPSSGQTLARTDSFIPGQ